MRLGDIASVKAGNVAPKKGLFSERGIPFVRAGSLSRLLDGESPRSLERIDKTTADKLGMHLFPEGTILFAKSGMSCMTGNVYVLKEPCYVVSHLACVAIDNTELTLYLKHYFRWNKPNALVENPSFPSIRLGKIKDMEIRLPDARQIARWVSTLERIEGLMETHEHQLSLLDDLVKSRFVEMFGSLEDNLSGWPVRQFGDFACIDTHMTKDLRQYKDCPHIGIDSIEKNTGRLSGYRTVAEDAVRSGKYPFDSRHIIYSKIRPALNKVALPNFVGVCSADAYPILPNEGNCDRVYLSYVMRSNYFLDYILPLSVRAQMPKVNKEALEGFTMPLPPLSLQREFAAFAAEVGKSRVVVQKQIEKLQTLYDSLAQEYFG